MNDTVAGQNIGVAYRRVVDLVQLRTINIYYLYREFKSKGGVVDVPIHHILRWNNFIYNDMAGQQRRGRPHVVPIVVQCPFR